MTSEEQPLSPINQARRPWPANPQKAQAARLEKAQEICTVLGESNTDGVRRLLELFGPTVVEAKAQAALAARAAAPPGDAERAKLDPLIYKRDGEPRTPGGIFFQMMAAYAEDLGIAWGALRIPAQPAPPKAPPTPSTDAPPSTTPATDTPATPAPTKAPVAADPPAPKAPPAPKPQAAPTEGMTSSAPASRPTAATPAAAPKPSRAKLTVVGTLGSPARTLTQGAISLVELAFTCEMNPSLPKGLPQLPPIPVRVWCTPKQWGKVQGSLTPTSRLLIEGEAGLERDKDGQPVLMLICLQLRNLDAPDDSTK